MRLYKSMTVRTLSFKFCVSQIVSNVFQVIPAAIPEAPSAPPAATTNTWFRWRRQSATSSSNSWLLWRKPPPAYSDSPVHRV